MYPPHSPPFFSFQSVSLSHDLLQLIMYSDVSCAGQVHWNDRVPSEIHYKWQEANLKSLVSYDYLQVHHSHSPRSHDFHHSQSLVSSPDQFFRARPADFLKNRVWTLSLRKLGHVYIWQSVNWVIVVVNYIISFQQRLLCCLQICKLDICDDA